VSRVGVMVLSVMRRGLSERGSKVGVSRMLVFVVVNPGEDVGGLGGGLRSSSWVMLAVFGGLWCPDVTSEPGDALGFFVLRVMVTIVGFIWLICVDYILLYFVYVYKDGICFRLFSYNLVE
jgi:hypothetical protein